LNSIKIASAVTVICIVIGGLAAYALGLGACWIGAFQIVKL
jgi:ABC-type spermidine/putrescine transport system permease subunit I